MKAVNGMLTVIRRDLPAFAEGGYDVKRFPKVDRESLRSLSLAELAELARLRVENAVAADREKKKQDWKYNATIGGKVRVETLSPKK